MVAHKTDVLCVSLAFIFILYQSVSGLNNSSVTTKYSSSLKRENSLMLLLLRNGNRGFRLKIPYMSRKCLVFMLLIMCGDVETCPGPDAMAGFSNMNGIKIIHQNIRGLLNNIGSLSLFLEKYKHIDIVTLLETHITLDGWNDNCKLYDIPGYTFVQRCRKNGMGGGVGMYISNNLKWKQLEIDSDKLETIWIEICIKNSKNFIVSTVYRPPDTSKYLPQRF